jgi:alkanesulfonate monooxygenase SsuD/methylene tetrahydromethanopterin reductase-like flavin-dependent oxidoreductase (luciferase family)
VRVGISLNSSYPGVADDEVTGMVIERARAAAAAGLATLSLGDHHSTGPTPYVQNVPMLARILAEWDERPAGCLFLVPLWNPVLMAEQIGTLASIATGPFIVQTGLGGRRDPAAMGLDVPHRGQRLEATIRVVQALLRGERVDDEQLGISGATIAPRPPRGVEWWIGAGTADALDRAARVGDCWYANADVDPHRAGEQRAVYVEACARHGREPGRTAVRKDVLVADDDAEARRAGTALIEAGYRGGMGHESVAFGDPQHVAEQLAVYGDIGFDEVVVRTMAGIPQAAALRSIELAGQVAELLATA